MQIDLFHLKSELNSCCASLQKLKAAVPNIVLKTCLDDMALDKDSSNQFADSDEESDQPKKSKKKVRDGNSLDLSLCFKAGRNPSTSLYYVDYNAAKNGNGLDREEKNNLDAKLAQIEAERDNIKMTIKAHEAETAKLLAEPKNDEAMALLESEGLAIMEAKMELEAARKFKVNEKHRQQLKQRIFVMTAEWRKRRRICMDFLTSMEDSTEGTVNARKCLSGDGQIDIDSDEAVAKHALEFGKKKRSKIVSSKKRSLQQQPDILADEYFVAVTLDSQGCVKRVFLDDA